MLLDDTIGCVSVADGGELISAGKGHCGDDAGGWIPLLGIDQTQSTFRIAFIEGGKPLGLLLRVANDGGRDVDFPGRGRGVTAGRGSLRDAT